MFILAALAVNQEPVALNFLAWQSPVISLFWWLLAAFLAGLLLGLLVVGFTTARLRLRARRLAKQLARAEKELGRTLAPHE